MMDCEQVRRWLERDLDGAAEPSGDVAAHLDRCRACAAEAGRTRAISEAARAALPPADVPVDFPERVLDEVLEPAGDQRLAAAARPRLRRWLPLLAVAALVPLAFLLRPVPAVRGDLRVERNGAWVATKTAEPGEVFGLEPGATAERAEVRITAQGATLLKEEDETVLVLAGDVVVETTRAGVTGTPLGEIRMRADSVCLATLESEGGVEMEFKELKRAAPAVLAVTVLAGGATVANAQGAQPAGPGERVIVEGSNPPRLDPEAVQRELDRLRVELEDARRQLALLRGEKPRSPNLRRQIAELDQAANANKAAIMQLARDLAELRMERDSPQNRARIAELEETQRKRIEVAKAHDEKRLALEKRLAAEEIVRESRDLSRMAEELRAEIAEDEISDEPFRTDEAAVRTQRLRTEIAKLEMALAAARQRYEESHPKVREMTVMLEHRREALRRYEALLPPDKKPQRRIETVEFDKDGNVVERAEVQLGDDTRRLEAPDPEKAALRAEIERLRMALAKYESEERWRLLHPLPESDEGVRALRQRIKLLGKQLADLKKRDPDERIAARIEQLEEVLEASKRELARATLSGRVLAVEEGLVVLSVGSDDGVAPGFVFNVNRQKEWIARVIVTEVEEHQCVARLELKRAEPELTPRKGDQVRRAD